MISHSTYLWFILATAGIIGPSTATSRPSPSCHLSDSAMKRINNQQWDWNFQPVEATIADPDENGDFRAFFSCCRLGTDVDLPAGMHAACLSLNISYATRILPSIQYQTHRPRRKHGRRFHLTGRKIYLTSSRSHGSTIWEVHLQPTQQARIDVESHR